MRKLSPIFCVAFILMLMVGCAKKIYVNFDEIQKGELIRTKMKSGETHEGLVKARNSSIIVVQPEKNVPDLVKINKEDVKQISVTPPVYDDKNEIITEWEIQDKLGTRNRMLYTLGGAGLSFGASFFVGSLAHRNLEDSEYQEEALWSITGVGTVLGAWLFHRAGAKKDRELAINEIRELRYMNAMKKMESEREKRREVKEKLNKLKSNKKKQDEEIERLKNRLKDRDKKVQQGDGRE